MLEVPGKRRLRPGHVARVQQGLYPGLRTFGMVAEPLALLSTIALAATHVVSGTDVVALPVAAALSYLALGLVFPLLTQRMNRRIAVWDPDELPADWRRTRRRWEFSHGLRAGLMLLSALLLAATALVAT